MGRPGRSAVQNLLPSLIEQHEPLFVLANGENSAGGVGITPPIANELFRYGIDGLTLGNHAFQKREIGEYLDSGKPIARPSNMPPSVPGTGHFQLERAGVTLTVINLCGRVFMEPYDDPFREVDRLLADLKTPHILIDFHGEATSEKIAFGWHVDGRASAVLGTHTHIPTADERILPEGTAYITDVGMSGPENGVIGMDREIVVKRFLTTLPAKFEVAAGPGVICGVVIDVQRETGRARSIRRVRIADD